MPVIRAESVNRSPRTRSAMKSSRNAECKNRRQRDDWIDAPSRRDRICRLRGQPLSRPLVEQVDVGWIDGEMNFLVGVNARPPVRAKDYLFVTHLDQELGLGAGRLHDDHF